MTADKLAKYEHCLNCGEKILGEYCYQCGQKSTVRRVSIWLLISDILDDYITPDSKLGRSLFLLFFKPGLLTKEYNEGKRAKYVRPLRLYIVASILYFFLFSTTVSIDDVLLLGTDAEEVPISEMNSPDSILSEESGSGGRIIILGMEPHEIDSIVDRMRTTLEDTSSTYFGSKINAFIIGQWERVRAKTMRELAGSIVSYLETNLPKMMFFLLPVFAFLLKIIYRRSRKFYVEHLIFSLHSHTFLFLTMSLVMVIKIDVLTLVGFTIALVYLFLSLRTAYAQSNSLTLARFTLLLGSYFIVLVLSFSTAILTALLFV